MCTIRDENCVNTCLLTSFVKKEKIADDGCADRHHTGEAKASQGTGTDESRKI
jgi:hypothetical protein